MLLSTLHREIPLSPSCENERVKYAHAANTAIPLEQDCDCSQTGTCHLGYGSLNIPALNLSKSIVAESAIQTARP